MKTAKELLMKPYKVGTKPEDIILGGESVLNLMEEHHNSQNDELKKWANQSLEHFEALQKLGGLTTYDNGAFDTFRTLKEKLG